MLNKILFIPARLALVLVLVVSLGIRVILEKIMSNPAEV